MTLSHSTQLKFASPLGRGRFLAVSRLRFIRHVMLLGAWLAVFVPGAWAGIFAVFGPARYARDNGEPGPVVQTFSVLDPHTTYPVDRQQWGFQRHRRPISTERDFNKCVTLLTKPVTPRANNQFSLELLRKPGESLTIQIIGVDNVPPTITAGPDRPPNAAD